MLSITNIFEGKKNDYMFRNKLEPGMIVLIVLKRDQGTNRRVKGAIKDILTKSKRHTRGIKVRLSDGQIGRVQKIL